MEGVVRSVKVEGWGVGEEECGVCNEFRCYGFPILMMVSKIMLGENTHSVSFSWLSNENRHKSLHYGKILRT